MVDVLRRFAGFFRILAPLVFIFVTATPVVLAQQTEKAPPQPTPVETHASATAQRGKEAALTTGPSATRCPFCNLRKANLANQDLTGANYSGADLTDADLSKAKLAGAVFLRANLTNAKLSEADLTSANFAGADLTGANLDNARISGTIFEFANLACADFSDTDTRASHFGTTLRIEQDKGCRPKFKNAKLGCEFHKEWNRIDTTAAVLEKCEAEPQSNYYCGAADISTLKNVIYVSNTSGTDSDTCGTSLSQQCKTIAKGIARCSGADCAVLVAYDRYSLTATLGLKDGVSVYGGCAVLPKPDPSYFSLIYAPPGVPGVQAVNIGTATLFQGFTIMGGDTAKGAANLASVGFLAQNSSLKLTYVTISAGTGGGGAGGASGNPGSPGKAATGQTGGSNTCVSNSYGANGAQKSDAWMSDGHCCAVFCVKYCATCNFRNYTGNYGGPGNTGVWAKGGGSGSNVCYGCPDSQRPGAAGNGDPGNAGGCLAGGAASSNTTGSIQNAVWVPSIGGAGQNGGDAGGGGGGGSGGSCGYISCWAGLSAYPGVAGGGGGAGGCGGSFGAGGQQGGASIALMINGGALDLSNGSIVGGAGGSGGQGGNGREGGTGGIGASAPSSNPCNDQGGAGGTGGTGGTGGAGSGGAGGNGGPAFGVVTFSGGTFRQQGTNFYLGTSGSFGGYGTGGSQSAGGKCSGNNGVNGVFGATANQQQF